MGPPIMYKIIFQYTRAAEASLGFDRKSVEIQLLVHLAAGMNLCLKNHARHKGLA